jgi:LysR family carnitine catabolism transcriptional activator
MTYTIRHIKAFLAVAQLENFTRAAVHLHVSQPALTVQVRQLEEALGVMLFDRNKRRVALTQAGRELLLPLERILVDTEAVMSATRELTGMRRGIVTIAALPSAAAGLLPVAIRAFREMYPGVVVRLNDVVAGSVAELVKSGEVDFGVGSQLRFDPELDVEKLLTDQICAFVPASHLLARKRALTLRDLALYPLILTGRNSSVREICERAFELNGLSVQIACEANYMSTAIAMVHAGLGIALLPASAVNSGPCGNLSVMPIRSSALTRHVCIMLSRGRAPSIAARTFMDRLKELAAEDTSPGDTSDTRSRRSRRMTGLTEAQGPRSSSRSLNR